MSKSNNISTDIIGHDLQLGTDIFHLRLEGIY